MKSAAKSIKPKTSAQKDTLKNSDTVGDHKELRTDSPLSEKDEVKQAEDKLRKSR